MAKLTGQLAGVNLTNLSVVLLHSSYTCGLLLLQFVFEYANTNYYIFSAFSQISQNDSRFL